MRLPVRERILFVDDDPRLLDGLRRRLRGRFAIETAVGPAQGLEFVADRPPFALVVADMNMPGMDGATFLGRVQQLSPDTVRMMLTGNADLGTAIAAINNGAVFRIMTKPIANEDLERFLEAGLEQRRLVASMRRAAAAEDASQAKADFLATVSHELRTPLTVIRSSAGILEHFAEDEPAEVRADFVTTISRYACHLDAMIGQLLQIAELDAREARPLCLESFDLVQTARAAVARAQEIVPEAAMPTMLATLPAICCTGERASIEAALVQLLVNALHVSPVGSPPQVVVAKSDTGATVDIVDRGPGVPAAIADRLFEPFVQCADVLTDKPPGLGLGLCIARKIARRHRGTLAFHRDADGCTHFVLSLPCDPTSGGRE